MSRMLLQGLVRIRLTDTKNDQCPRKVVSSILDDDSIYFGVQYRKSLSLNNGEKMMKYVLILALGLSSVSTAALAFKPEGTPGPTVTDDGTGGGPATLNGRPGKGK